MPIALVVMDPPHVGLFVEVPRDTGDGVRVSVSSKDHRRVLVHRADRPQKALHCRDPVHPLKRALWWGALVRPHGVVCQALIVELRKRLCPPGAPI